MVSLPQVNLPSSSSMVSTSFGFELAGDYAFYDRNPDSTVEPNYYQHIISTAKKIVIWDPHFMENEDGKLFEAVTYNDVEIEILTVCKDEQDDKSVNTLRDNIKNSLKKAGITNHSGAIFAFKHYKVKDLNDKRLYQCHDRFLMIDDSIVYLVGASMNNQQRSEWNFGIMKIEKSGNYEIYKLISDKYAWLKTKVKSTQNGWKTALKP